MDDDVITREDAMMLIISAIAAAGVHAHVIPGGACATREEAIFVGLSALEVLGATRDEMAACMDRYDLESAWHSG